MPGIVYCRYHVRVLSLPSPREPETPSRHLLADKPLQVHRWLCDRYVKDLRRDFSHPGHVIVTAEKVAKEKRMLCDEVLEQAYATTKAFYSLDR